MNKVRQLIESVTKNSFYACVISIIFGLVLFFFPGAAINTLVIVMGALMVLAGASTVFSWYRNKSQYADMMPIVLSALVALLGLYFIFRPSRVASLLPTIVGIFILIHGLVSFFSARNSNAGAKGMAPAIISIILGIVLLINPFGALKTALRIVGIFVVVDGVGGLITAKS